MRATCRINRELMEQDVSCYVLGEGEWCDYGVPRSPRWLEFSAIDIAWPIDVSGVEHHSEEELEAAHPGMTAAILECADEDGDWELDEY